MGITNILSLLSGVALFLFGMSQMGDGLKKAAGEKLELILYKLTSTPLKGVLLGTAVTAIIQSSSATSVMVVGFVNAGMMKVAQAIGIIMGANIGTSVTGWILCLSYIDGGSGVAQILSTATISAVVAIVGILFKMVAKKVSVKNVGDIMLGFSILMVGMQMMSGAMSPLKSDPEFIELFTMFSNPFVGIIVGILFTAVLQSASASIGILQALSVMGGITFASAFPITMGIGVGAAVPVLLSSIGTNKNGKRTALIYLLNDLFGMVFWSVAFYTVNAFVHFDFLDMVMSPVSIAILNSVFRVATVVILFPFIKWIEKLVFLLVKDAPEELADFADLDLLEERFLNYPALAIGQSHTAMNGMAKKARKNVIRAMNLLSDFSENKYQKVQEKENLIDKYEDQLGTYLMQLTGREMTEPQAQQVSILLHSVSDFERLGDHAVNIAGTANELHEKKVSFSDEANRELKVLENAVQEIIQITVTAFDQRDNHLAVQVEPLRELIIALCDELKSRHVARLRKGQCEWKQGFPFNNLLTDFERIAAHCSNIALAMIEAETASFDMHKYEKSIREKSNAEYVQLYDTFEDKYKLPTVSKKKDKSESKE